MRVAVITPYYKEPLEQLIRCHQSVLIQKANVTHFLVSDGYPNAVLDQWDCEHIRLSHHNDYGDTPRGIGAASASAQGFDAICFLDADNWYEPHHLETMISTFKRYRVPVVTTSRALYTNDGQYLGQCKESDGIHFVDTNCYFFINQLLNYVQHGYLNLKVKALLEIEYFGKELKMLKFRMYIIGV